MARHPGTPGSTTRRLALASAGRSCPRPGTSSALRLNNELNKQLQFNLQETDAVEVYCRIKPLDGNDSCIRVLDDTTLALIPPDSSAAWKQGIAKEQHYSFQRVFGSDAPQKLIFDEIALPLVKVIYLVYHSWPQGDDG